MKRLWTLALGSVLVVAGIIGLSHYKGADYLAKLYAPVEKTIVIGYDGGGLIGDYIKFTSYILNADIKVRITGACISACTLLLSLPKYQVCIEPDAKLGFHMARDAETGKVDPEATAQLIKMFYPLPVQKWIAEHGPLTIDPIYMEGSEAIKLGVLERCQ